MSDSATNAEAIRLLTSSVEQFKSGLEEFREQREAQVLESIAGYREFSEILKLRIAFFDKLLVFDTGVIAITITYLAALGGHTLARMAYGPLHLLYTGWILLVVSILFSGFTNVLRTYRTEALFGVVGAQQKEHRTVALSAALRNMVRAATALPVESEMLTGFKDVCRETADAIDEEGRAASSLHGKLFPSLPAFSRIGIVADGAALSTTVLGLIFLLAFVMGTAWVLTFK